MRWSATMLVVLLLYPTPMREDDRVLDWVKVTDKAAWQARDSSGEVVYKDKLWLLGGWFDSFSAPPRDVWSSPGRRNLDARDEGSPVEVQRPADEPQLRRPHVAHGRLV